MWYYYVIGILIDIILIAVYVYFKTKQNKYYFWKSEAFIEDRNGARKPSLGIGYYFGKHPKKPTVETLIAQAYEMSTSKTIIKTIKEEISDKSKILIPTHFNIDEDKKSILREIQNLPDAFPEKEYKVEIDKEKHIFNIYFDDVRLSDGGLRVWSYGRKYTSFPEEIDPDHELKAFLLHMKATREEEGIDSFGSYKNYIIAWSSQNKEVECITTIRVYKSPACVMFRIAFEHGLENTAMDSYGEQCVQFPVFRNQSNRSLVFSYSQSNFAEPVNRFVPTSAPILFYNSKLETFIVSPTMNFLIAWNTPDKKNNEIRMGIEGDIKKIPQNFIHETILYSDRGIINTFKHWGDLLLKYYQKERFPNDGDQVLKYLGYWTDAGTYYYYNKDEFLSYQNLLLKIKEKADKEGIPYGYFQLDSWFYPKDDGTLEWEGIPDEFPAGIKGLVDHLKLPVLCHNRWFSRNSPYRSQFKGWVVETHPLNRKKEVKMKKKKNMAPGDRGTRTWILPTNREFWDFLMQNAKSWGCVTYEQDWLYPQWEFFDYLRSDVNTGRIWLHDMAEAAADNNLSIQYCMPYPSFYLATLELPNVTHARCSDDYNHRKPKRIYIPHFTQTSILAWSVGVWPWKDSFLSTCYPEKGSVGPTEPIPPHYEQYNELEFLLQVLSGGPVGNGDHIDLINKDLIMQSCREDGILLKPDRPLFPVELMFMEHSKPYITSTYSTIMGEKWWYVLEIMVWEEGVEEKWFTPSELGLSRNYVVYDYGEKKLMPVGPDDKIGPNTKIHEFKPYDHKYYVLSPVLSNGMAFIGFRDKVITMPSKVFNYIMVINDRLIVKGKYLPFQEFTIIAYVPKKPKYVAVNGEQTDVYTWGPYYKTLTLTLKSDTVDFKIEIE